MTSRVNMMYGNTYLSAYSIAVKHGFVGSEQDWLNSIGSGSIELKYFEDREMLCWKHQGDSEWTDLMSLSELQKNLASAIIGDMRDEAKEYALLAQSWAVGGTGLRSDENVNNARYWASIAGSGGSSNGTGNGKRPATVIVGAAAAGHGSDEVDYLCYGSADEDTLNLAMAAAGSDGTVVVLPGSYQLTDTVTCTGTVFASGAEFTSGAAPAQGLILLNGGHLIGAAVTKTAGTGTPCITAKAGSRITDCRIAPGTGDTGVQAADLVATASKWNVIVENCSFTTECLTAVAVTDYCVVRGCHITKARGYGIHLADAENFVEGNIIDLYLSDSNRGVGIGVSGRYNHLVDNTMRNTTTTQEFVLESGATQNMVVGNFAHITDNGGSNYIMANLSDVGTGSGGSGGTGAVDSVNGKTGVVVLSASDVGAAAVDHTHSADEITGGVLSIDNGGTGASTVLAARQALGVGIRGVCSTAAATALKAVSLDGFPGLTAGVMVAVRFTNGNTAEKTTLNVSGSGALDIIHNGSAITTEMIPTGWEAVLQCVTGRSAWPDWELMNPYRSATSYLSKDGDVMTGDLITTGLVVGTLEDNSDLGEYTSARGYHLVASGDHANAEGYLTKATALYAHAEGQETTVTGKGSHAEGYGNTVSGGYSHVEGQENTVTGSATHGEGGGVTAAGSFTHAEGFYTNAVGNYSRAQGRETTSTGLISHAGGYGTKADGYLEFVQGRYNTGSNNSASAWAATGNAVIIGNGSSDTVRSNSFRINNAGAVYALSAFNSSGADYGEYCEWADGNPAQEDRLGYFVTWDGERVRTATAGDSYILGVSTKKSAVIGNSDVSNWNGMYLTNRWGEPVTETFLNEMGKRKPGSR